MTTAPGTVTAADCEALMVKRFGPDWRKDLSNLSALILMNYIDEATTPDRVRITPYQSAAGKAELPWTPICPRIAQT